MVTRSSGDVLAAVIVAFPAIGCAGGRKKENVIVNGMCKIANLTGGRSVTGNYPQHPSNETTGAIEA